MRTSPDWLMPPMSKSETSPYDLLIDLVPWYVEKAPRNRLIGADTL